MDLTQRTATPDGYFEDVWSAGDDPWEHGTRWYETRKYDLTVAALPRSRYRRSFCLLYTSPSPRDKRQSRMPSSA